jgi:hypothetical protein
MKIGQVEIKPEDLKKKPKEPMWQSPFARKDCDCDECSAIIKYDAWFIYNDNDGMTDQRLIYRVSQLNGWIEDGPYVA